MIYQIKLHRALLGVWLAFSCHVLAEPSIGVFLDSALLSSGTPTPALWVAGQGGDALQVVDVHVVLVAPDGTIYEYPDWNTDLRPWLPAFNLRSGVKVDPIRLTDLGNLPFPLTSGRWRLGGALTRPGTLDFVSLNIQPFQVISDTQIGQGARIGFLSMMDMRSAGLVFGNNLTVSTTQVASGYFSQVCPDQALGDLPDDLPEQALDNIPIDQCRIEESENSNDDSPVDTPSCGQTIDLDAGPELLLVSDRGDSVRLPRQSSLTYFSDLPSGFFQTNATYTFSGTGGADIGPFSASQKAPPRLEVTRPDLLSGTASLDPKAALTVNWNGNGGQGTVFVTLVSVQTGIDLGQLPSDPGSILNGSDLASTSSRIVHCRFADDGEGTVPEDLIRQLTEGMSNNPLVPLTMSAFRFQMNFFNTDRNELDYGTFVISSAVSGTLSLDGI